MQQTVWDFLALPRENQQEIKEKLNNLPFFDIYINKDGKRIFLCHAGIALSKNEIASEKDLIWDRLHLIEAYDGQDLYVVHGHTPVPYLSYTTKNYLRPKNEEQIYNYCGGHKFDIDLGSFDTKKVALFNLDTFETIYFIDKE